MSDTTGGKRPLEDGREGEVKRSCQSPTVDKCVAYDTCKKTSSHPPVVKAEAVAAEVGAYVMTDEDVAEWIRDAMHAMVESGEGVTLPAFVQHLRERIRWYATLHDRRYAAFSHHKGHLIGGCIDAAFAKLPAGVFEKGRSEAAVAEECVLLGKFLVSHCLNPPRFVASARRFSYAAGLCYHGNMGEPFETYAEGWWDKLVTLVKNNLVRFHP